MEDGGLLGNSLLVPHAQKLNMEGAFADAIRS